MASLLGEVVKQHTHDGNEGTRGRERGEHGLENGDRGGDQEDALEGASHGISHGVHVAQAPEGHFICIALHCIRTGVWFALKASDAGKSRCRLTEELRSTCSPALDIR